MPIIDNGVSIVRLYDGTTEILTLNDQGVLVHKRITVTFALNYGSAGNYATQTKTWGVENITNPGTPSRSGYTFNGWYTAASGGSKLSLPFVAGNANVTYYAQWSAQSSPKTATPTLATPRCEMISGTNYLKVNVTNNDASTVTIRGTHVGQTQVLGTLAAGANKSFDIYSVFNTPYTYNISVTATASGKTESSSVSRSGTVNFCIASGL